MVGLFMEVEEQECCSPVSLAVVVRKWACQLWSGIPGERGIYVIAKILSPQDLLNH